MSTVPWLAYPQPSPAAWGAAHGCPAPPTNTQLCPGFWFLPWGSWNGPSHTGCQPPGSCSCRVGSSTEVRGQRVWQVVVGQWQVHICLLRGAQEPQRPGEGQPDTEGGLVSGVALGLGAHHRTRGVEDSRECGCWPVSELSGRMEGPWVSSRACGAGLRMLTSEWARGTWGHSPMWPRAPRGPGWLSPACWWGPRVHGRVRHRPQSAGRVPCCPAGEQIVLTQEEAMALASGLQVHRGWGAAGGDLAEAGLHLPWLGAAPEGPLSPAWAPPPGFCPSLPPQQSCQQDPGVCLVTCGASGPMAWQAHHRQVHPPHSGAEHRGRPSWGPRQVS